MNKNLISLIRLNLFEFFGLNSLLHSQNKKEKRKSIFILLGIALLGLIFCGYSTGVWYGYSYLGLGDWIPLFSMILAGMLTFISCFFKANSLIYESKDLEILLSLPIKTRTVLESRFFLMYVWSFLGCLVLMVPGGVIYTLLEAPKVFSMVCFWVSIPMIPLVPMMAAILIQTIIYSFSKGPKRKKGSVVGIVLTFVLIFGIMGLSFSLSGQSEAELNIKIAKEVKELSKIVLPQIFQISPPAYWYYQGIVKGELWYYILFIILQILVYQGGLFLLSKKYLSLLNKNMISISSNRNWELAGKKGKDSLFKKNSPFKAFYIKELKRYFSSTIYVLNTMIGSMFLLVFAGVFLFLSPQMIFTKLELTPQMIGIFEKNPEILGVFIGMIEAIMISTVAITASSISLEGKQKFIPMTAPVSYGTIYLSKIAVNLTITLPAVILGTLFLIPTLYPDFLGIFLTFFVPASMTVFLSILGLYLNLKFPKYQWSSEVAVVKQGIPVMVCVLGGMLFGFLAMMVVTYFVTIKVEYGVWFELILFLILDVISYVLFQKIRKIKMP